MAWDEGNFLSALLGQANSMEPSFMRPPAPRPMGGMPMGGTQPGSMGGPSLADIERQAGAPRKRASVVDILGGLFDTAAELGGVNPQYQPTLDARLQREREAELYPLEVQKAQLGNRDVRGQIQERQAKLMAPLAQRAKQYLEQGGDINKILPVMYQTLGLTPDEVQQYDPQIRANPMETLSMLAVSGEQAGEEYGLTPTRVRNPNTGEVLLIQMGKSGRSRSEAIPPGFELADPLMAVERGPTTDLVSRQSGQTKTSFTVGGKPETGYIQTGQTEDGRPIFGPAPGTKAENELVSAADTKLSGYQGTLTSLNAIDTYSADLRASLDALKATGSMTGVDSQGWLGNLRALGYQNIPGIERTFNSHGGSARKTVDSITTNLATNFMNAVKKATDEGTSSASRLLDTEKEVQRLKESVTNADDYNSAVAALDRFNAYVAETKAYISLQAAKAAEKRARVGSKQPAAPSSGEWKIERID
jgi:hypothetical protein